MSSLEFAIYFLKRSWHDSLSFLLSVKNSRKDMKNFTANRQPYYSAILYLMIEFEPWDDMYKIFPPI